MSETNNEGIDNPLDTTVVADQTPPTAEDTGAEVVAEETADPAEPVAEKQPEPDPAPKKRPWWETRIAETAFEAREAKRRADVAEAELAKLRQPSQATRPDAVSGMVPVTEVETRAAQMLAETRFVDQCNETYDAGVEKYPDFEDAAKTYGLLGPMPSEFLQAVTSLGKDDGARVYYELGKNPDEAARILKLPPARMAMEIAKIAYTQPAPAKIKALTKAPAPIEPLTSNRARSDVEPDEVKNPKEWSDWFIKQRLARR